PAVGGGVLAGVQVLLQCLGALRQRLIGLVNFDLGQKDRLLFLGVRCQPDGGVELGEGVVVPAVLGEQVGVSQDEVEVVLLQRQGVGQDGDRLFLVAEAVE